VGVVKGGGEGKVIEMEVVAKCSSREYSLQDLGWDSC